MKRDGDVVVEGRTCADCGEPFTITAGETSYYARRGLVLPKRCPDCRAARRLAPLEEGEGPPRRVGDGGHQARHV
jgi:hypothetical protein